MHVKIIHTNIKFKSYLVSLHRFSYKLRGLISRKSSCFISIIYVCTSFNTNSQSFEFRFKSAEVLWEIQSFWVLEYKQFFVRFKSQF